MRDFAELCRIEPELLTLLADAAICGAMANDEDFWQEISRIKSRLIRIVGWESSNPLLCDSDDYETAYRAIVEEAELARERRMSKL